MNSVIEYSLEFEPKYFFRMDADDVCFRGRLARQVQFLRQNDHVDVVGSSVVEIDETGRGVGRRTVPTTHHEIMRMMPKRCLINHPTVAMRYSIFKKGCRYRSDLRNTQDYFLWVDLAVEGYTFANINKPLLKFRRTKGFFKRRGRGKSINEFRARWYAMRSLKRVSLGNLYYAVTVLCARMLPNKVLKALYRIDRLVLHLWARRR
jgi:glycosyltransferase involved in cell wall biosynthesis